MGLRCPRLLWPACHAASGGYEPGIVQVSRQPEQPLAGKQVMTVRADGWAAEVPAPQSRRRAPALNDRAIAELIGPGEQPGRPISSTPPARIMSTSSGAGGGAPRPARRKGGPSPKRANAGR